MNVASKGAVWTPRTLSHESPESALHHA